MKTSYDIILKPLVTEQSMEDVSKKKYAFKVDPNSNKIEIKKAIEEAFGVSVASVNTMNYDGKLKRMGVHQGRRSKWKKAIVTLKGDSKAIEFFDNMV